MHVCEEVLSQALKAQFKTNDDMQYRVKKNWHNGEGRKKNKK